MAFMLTWDDTGEIAEALCESYPETDPLSVSFPRLLRMVCELNEFDDNPEAATESRLEEIQMAWFDLMDE